MERTVVLAFALAGACASSRAPGRSDATGASAVPEVEYVATLFEARCDHAERCCAMLGRAPSDCRTQAAEVERTRWVPAASSGARYDPRAAAACVEALRSAPCHRSKAPYAAPAPCREVYERGWLQVGEPCDNSFECASGLTCGVDRVTRDGIEYACRHHAVVAEGDRCAGEGLDLDAAYECELPLLCDEARGVCVARAARGEPCITGPVWGDTCAEGSVCDRLGSRTCVEPTPVGDPCSSIEECESLACIEGTCREPSFDAMRCARGE